MGGVEGEGWEGRARNKQLRGYSRRLLYQHCLARYVSNGVSCAFSLCVAAPVVVVMVMKTQLLREEAQRAQTGCG